MFFFKVAGSPLEEPSESGSDSCDSPAVCAALRPSAGRSPGPESEMAAPGVSRRPGGPVASTPYRSSGSASSAGLTPISAGRQSSPTDAHLDSDGAPPPAAALRAGPAPAARSGLVRLLAPRAAGLVKAAAGPVHRPTAPARAPRPEPEAQPPPTLKPPRPSGLAVPRATGIPSGLRPPGAVAPRGPVAAGPRAASAVRGPRPAAGSGLRPPTASGLRRPAVPAPRNQSAPAPAADDRPQP